MWQLSGRGGGQVVNVLTFYIKIWFRSEVYDFYIGKIVAEKNKNRQMRPWLTTKNNVSKTKMFINPIY